VVEMLTRPRRQTCLLTIVLPNLVTLDKFSKLHLFCQGIVSMWVLTSDCNLWGCVNLYRWFPSKDLLIEAVMNYSAAQWIRWF